MGGTRMHACMHGWMYTLSRAGWLQASMQAVAVSHSFLPDQHPPVNLL